MTIDGGAHVSTPGATKLQAADIYSNFASGNTKAVEDGKMGALKGGSGLLAAANGLFNANKGINNNARLMILQTDPGTQDYGPQCPGQPGMYVRYNMC